MFIGHIPAGYILTKMVQKNMRTTKYLLVGLVASILPDIDMFYFYLIDNKQNLHHSYWIHIPFYWFIIGAVTFLAIWLINKKEYYVAAIIFFSNIFLHLLLDTIVGKIEWLYPFTDQAFYWFEVPSVYAFWVYNFIFHWTFLLEVGVIISAGYILIQDRFLKPSLRHE